MGTMTDDLDQYFLCVETSGRWEFQVGVVSWVDGPHSPRLVWRPFRTWTKRPNTDRLARAKTAALRNPRFFRICTRCGQLTNTGLMHDRETCQRCASRLFGILY